MALPDVLSLKYKILSTSVISESYQVQGKRSRQEDYVFHDSVDTFVIADGMGGLPHGDVAGKLALESAVWAIRLAKERPAYWKDKKLLGGRIFRSVNWTLYNKRREKEYSEGLGSTLAIVLFGEIQFYVFSVGDSRIYLCRHGTIELLTPLDRDSQGNLTKAVGIHKSGPEPSYYTSKFRTGDMFLLATDGVADYLTEDNIQTMSENIEHSPADLSKEMKNLVGIAEKRGSADNMSVCAIKIIKT